MRTQIPITGITTSSSYSDGDCLSLVNLRKKNGVLKPVTPRKIINTLSHTYDELFVHELPNTDKNWIGVRDNKLYWIEAILTTQTEHELCSVSSIPQITQIGNVLNILDSQGLKYVIWYEGSYKLIDSNFDGVQTDTSLLPVKIDLKVDGIQTTQTISAGPGPTVTVLTGKELRRYYSESAFNYSTLAEFTADRANRIKSMQGLYSKSETIEKRDGRLTGFLYACTALELFDGSFILHSNPVLLGQSWDSDTRYDDGTNNYLTNRSIFSSDVLSMGYNNTSDGYYYGLPIYINPSSYVAVTGVGKQDNTITERYPDCFSEMFYTNSDKKLYFNRNSNKLSFKINQTIDEKYRPLVKSISIFISPQISMFDISKDPITSVTNSFSGPSPYTTITVENITPYIKSDSDLIKELALNQHFYKVKEIAFTDINTTVGTWIDLTEDLKGKLGDNLVNQIELPVDNFTHHALLPQKQMVYNSRLHALDYKTILSRGWPVNYFKNIYSIGQFQPTINTSHSPTDKLSYAEVLIKTDVGISKVVRIDTNDIGIGAFYPMLSYPDSRATQITIYQYLNDYSGSAKVASKVTYKLIPSSTHNFAYYITPDIKPISLSPISVTIKEAVPSESQREQIFQNGMKVSGLSNPFNFPAINTYQVGTGKLLNAASNAMRTSDGQFGQYPLYVFSQEGIYAINVGTPPVAYSTISPISNEIPVSSVICSTPFGVIFIGKRGLFIINGSQVDFLTPQLEQEPLSVALNMPLATGSVAPAVDVPIIGNIKTWNDWFKTYLLTVTEIAYDNQNNEIIIINPTKDYNLVYNLDSKEIYQQTEIIDKVVGNVYPELLVQDALTIKDFGQKKMTTDTVPVPVKADVSFIIRPFNFGTTDLKRLERIALRARLSNSEDIIVINHCSNDGVNFVPVQGRTINDGNYRDIDLGMMTRNKHRQFIYCFAAKLDENSQINILDAEVTSEYDNEKMK